MGKQNFGTYILIKCLHLEMGWIEDFEVKLLTLLVKKTQILYYNG